MAEYTLDNILAGIRGEEVNDPYARSSSKKISIPTKLDAGNEIQDVKYDVHQDAIFDRLHDGTYVAKFENYKGSTGNENRLAREQSGFEQIYSGLSKNLAKVGVYALDATVGTVVGIANALDKGSWEGLYDNDFSNTMDDWNKELDYALPNYYSDEQKAKGVLASMGTVNFWANDVAGGLAFVGGALLPEIALAAVTGGASAPGSIGKIGLKLAGKKILKESVEAGAKTIGRVAANGVKNQAGVDLLRASRFAKAGNFVGEAGKTAGFLVRTSNFEAGMEARHNLHQSTEEYLDTFKELNGRNPTFDEYSDFMDIAKTAANWVYGTNMAILSVSNAVMFGSKFGIGINAGKRATNIGNSFIGLGVTQELGEKAVLATATRGQKLLGKTYKYLGAASTEGLFEEGLQGVAGTTMQKYLKAKYDPEVENSYGLSSAISEAFSQQYGTKEGWKEMTIGMLIGVIAPFLQGKPLGMKEDSYAAKRKALETGVEKVNNGLETLRNLDRSNTMSQFKTAMTTENGEVSVETANSVINMDFIKTQEHLKTPTRIIEEFEAIVDNMKFDDSQIEVLGSTELADQYKESIKTEFREDAKNYKLAKSLVRSIELDKRTKTTPGNIDLITDAVITNMVVGESAGRKSEIIGKRLDELTGKDGLYDSVKFYSNLDKQQKGSVEILRKKKRRLSDLRKLAITYGQKAAISTVSDQGVASKKASNKYNTFAEKVVLTQQEVTKLEEEIRDLGDALNSEFRAVSIGMEGTLGELEFPISAEDMINNIDQFDDYKVALLKAGKSKEANELDQLTGEFKKYSDAKRQMGVDIRSMFDTDFFKKPKAKKLIKRLVGTEYKISEDFQKILKENSSTVINALRLVGLETTVSAEDTVTKALVENEEISDREKYRIEAIIRTVLGSERVRQKIERLSDTTEIVSSFNKVSSDPLVGDTIALKTQIGIKDKDLTNLEVLNSTIDSVLEEVDSLRNIRGERARVKVLQEELTELEDRLSEEQNTGEESERERKEQSVINIKEELKDLNSKVKGKISTTEEYKKLKTLSEKRRNKTITPAELTELNQTISNIDDWVLITGTVVEGFRLSDLIRQKLALEDVDVLEIDEVETVTSQQMLDQIDISDKKGGVSYSYGQTYAAVTAVGVKEGIEISGVTPETFSNLTGGVEFQTNEQGNVIVSSETQLKINQQGRVLILPTNKDLTTNYSLVLQVGNNLEGQQEVSPLMSTFNQSDFSGEMNADSIYEQEKGGELVLEVNPTDLYNVKLLDAYKKALGTGENSSIYEENTEGLEEALLENPSYMKLLDEFEELEYQETKATTLSKPGITKRKLKKKAQLDKKRSSIIEGLTKGDTRDLKTNLEKAIEDLRTGLLIRVKDSEGNFMAVLKGKRKGIKSPEASKFEAIRDQITADTEFLTRLTQTGISEEIRNVGQVFTKKVLIGHPNFNFTKNEDGSTAIESREITSEDVKHITDIGFVENGVISTKTSKKGIDTTFISKSIKNASSAKAPFVVLTKGQTKFAYPVKAIALPKESLQEFRDIFEATDDKVSKAIKLNTYMAKRGIDIKASGNSFIGLHKDNLNNEFFSEKLAQLEAIDYFDNLNSWVDPKVSIVENIAGKVTVDLKIGDPLHSPKIQMDFSAITAVASPVKSSQKERVKTHKKVMTNEDTGAGASKLGKFKDC